MRKCFFYLFVMGLFSQSSCDKNDSLPQEYPQGGFYTLTVVDAITLQPIDSAYVNVGFSCSVAGQWDFTNSDGVITFEDGNCVLTALKASKNGYCNYIHQFSTPPSNIRPSRILLQPISYIRFNINNINSLDGADKISTGYLGPYIPLSNNYHSISFTGVVDTSLIVESYTGNLGINYTVWSGATELYSSNISITTIGRDTIDVFINY